MRLAGPPPRPRGLIGITPLIDVVFILLFFFMLASSLERWQSIDLHLTTGNAPPLRPTETLKLKVGPGAQVEWQGGWFGRVALLERLKPIGRERPLVLDPANGTTIQDLVSVLESLRHAGYQRVSLAVTR
jgi:biopolymer transport protein ExbD